MRTIKLGLVVLFSIAIASCGGGGGGGGTAPDTTPPTVSSTSPANNATGVAVNAAITATFSENMDAATISTASFTLNDGIKYRVGQVTYSGTTATFTPTSNLAYSTTYTATISTAVKDAAGNAMAINHTWRFTTGTAPDTTPPTVSSTSPADNATGVPVHAAITATFSETMDAATITTASFTLNNSVTGVVTYSGTTATFTPSANLALNTAYTATITTVKDAAGNAMAVAPPYTWTFTTWVAPSINDTGITASQCYQTGSNVLVACNSAGAIALNTAQDGMVGRDANVATNNNTDGKLGFSYTSITGGCVLDNVTGLMWEVKTIDGGLRDWNNTYTNYDSILSAQKWDGLALAYVAPTQAEIDATTNSVGFKNSVNTQGLCGYSDWLLPTADELQSIVDYGLQSFVDYGGFAFPGPAIDANWFPNTNMQGKGFWSASPHVRYSNDAWNVNFGNGDVGNTARYLTNYVRLVRAGQSPTTPRYTVSADGQEVTDNQTKLIWRRCAEGMVFSGGTCTGIPGSFTHEAALQQAAAQARGAGIAWRLPNVKELSSIADKSLFGPAIDSAAFPATPAEYLFSSASPQVYNSDFAWFVSFGDGGIYGGGNRSVALYVRLVRAGQ